MNEPFTREQRMTIIYGVLCLVLITVVLQLWLLAATMNAYLAGDDSILWPAALASLACFAINVVLLRAIYAAERSRPGAAASPSSSSSTQAQ